MNLRVNPSDDDLEVDVGSSALTGLDVAERFNFWRGQSGRRYVFSVFRLEDHPPFEQAVAVLVQRKPHHRRRALWIGRLAGEDWSSVLDLAVAADADEVHLHLLAADEPARLAVVKDLDPHGRRAALPVRARAAG